MPQYLQHSFAGFTTPKKAVEVLSRAESEKLLEVARSGLSRDFLMVEMALYTGLRCAELIGLNIEHVMPEEQVRRTLIVTSNIAKGGKAREIPLHPQLRIDLEEYLGDRAKMGWPSDDWCPLFISIKTGRRLSTRDFQRISRSLGIAAIGRPINPHMLRHTFATRLLENSNLRVVQMALGHTSIASTQVYVHPNSDDMSRAVGALSGPGSPRQERGGDGQ